MSILCQHGPLACNDNYYVVDPLPVTGIQEMYKRIPATGIEPVDN